MRMYDPLEQFAESDIFAPVAMLALKFLWITYEVFHLYAACQPSQG